MLPLTYNGNDRVPLYHQRGEIVLRVLTTITRPVPALVHQGSKTLLPEALGLPDLERYSPPGSRECQASWSAPSFLGSYCPCAPSRKHAGARFSFTLPAIHSAIHTQAVDNNGEESKGFSSNPDVPNHPGIAITIVVRGANVSPSGWC